MKVEWRKQIIKVSNNERDPRKKEGKDQKPQGKTFHFKPQMRGNVVGR